MNAASVIPLRHFYNKRFYFGGSVLIFNLIVFAAILFLLAKIYKSTQKLGQTVFIGLFLGLASGAFLQTFYEKATVDCNS